MTHHDELAPAGTPAGPPPHRAGVDGRTAWPVVLFTNSFLMGGMEGHLIQLGRGLVARTFQVAAICSDAEAIWPLRAALAEGGVAVHDLPDRGRSGLGAVRRLRALARILRRYPGCILHLHLTGHRGGDLVALAGHLAGARAIVRTMHLPPLAPVSRRERASVRLRDALLARIICVSEQNLRAHLELLGREPRKCTVVPNGIDLERFSPAVAADGVRSELGMGPEHEVVGTVARLDETRKGIAYFIEMAAEVARERPAARFVVVGDGELRADLQRQARALGVGGKMIFTGERRDIPRLLAAMQVFVMPSLYEAGPYTLLEAMATARPVVTTSTGLAPEVVEHGRSGLLVPLADSRALSLAVVKILRDDRLAWRLGQHGRQRVAERFSLDAMVDGLVAVYGSAAGA